MIGTAHCGSIGGIWNIARPELQGCAAESRADIIHKLGICLKELRECRFWIRLIIKTELLPDAKVANLLDECTQFCNIIGQSVLTAKENRRREK